jgi:Domain of unknown function (DUF3644)
VPRRNTTNRLKDNEVSIIKAMIESGRFAHDQEMLAYFTRPGRTINHARIVEIREAMTGDAISNAARRFVHQPIAGEDELAAFLARFPEIDARTGLHIVDDELLIKAREAMLLAVQAFNNPMCYFKAEIFIVAAVIAWTYLLHVFYRRERVEYIYRERATGEPLVTPRGQHRHFDLAQCLTVVQCPLTPGEKRNLEYLIGLRHEIEHQSTSRIDDAISAKLQACSLNFNAVIKRLFGERCGVDRDLSVGLQFSRIDAAQRKATSAHRELPAAIAAYNAAFDGQLSQEELNDPAYAYRVALVPITINNPRKADEVFEILDRESPEAEAIAMLLRDRERPKHKPGQVVNRMQTSGFPKFSMHYHTQLWKRLDSRKPGKGFGTYVAGTWYWYDSWVAEVLKHCEAEGDRYR